MSGLVHMLKIDASAALAEIAALRAGIDPTLTPAEQDALRTIAPLGEWQIDPDSVGDWDARVTTTDGDWVVIKSAFSPMLWVGCTDHGASICEDVTDGDLVAAMGRVLVAVRAYWGRSDEMNFDDFLQSEHEAYDRAHEGDDGDDDIERDEAGDEADYWELWGGAE